MERFTRRLDHRKIMNSTIFVLIVTVDIEPPTANDNPDEWRQYFAAEVREYLDPSLEIKAFAKSELPQRNVELIAKAIKAGITGRTGVEFLPLFNFLYQDGHQMLTMGGMVGSAVEKRKIKGSGLADVSYFRDNFDNKPCIIKVPRLTRKERQHLDSFMPCKDSWKPEEFEISSPKWCRSA
jgi:hypothetical protein